MIATDRWRSEPPCVYPPAKAGHMAKRRVGVEYSPSMLEPVRSGAVSPDRALCLPTFSHFWIVNKTSLSLSLSLSLSPCCAGRRYSAISRKAWPAFSVVSSLEGVPQARKAQPTLYIPLKPALYIPLKPALLEGVPKVRKAPQAGAHEGQRQSAYRVVQKFSHVSALVHLL